MSTVWEMRWGGGTFLWWLMAQHQLQLSFGGRRVRTGVHVRLPGGVCTYKYVLCRWSVRVWVMCAVPRGTRYGIY